MGPQHILIINYTFPPLKGIGGRRWAKFAKYLAHKGHTIHVVHCAAEEKDKGSHWNADIAHEKILRYPLTKNYPSVLSKRPLTSLLDKLAYRYWAWALPKRVKGNIYDKTIFWKNDLLKTCKGIIEEHKVKNVVVSGAPFRLLYFATEFKRLDVHLIGDFRDPWTWSDVYGYKNLSNERMAYEKMMERTVIEKFDRILSPAPAILDHLTNAYPNVDPGKFLRIAHAFDQDDLDKKAERIPPKDKLRLIYAGSMYGAEEAELYFTELLAALAAIRIENEQRLEHFKLDLYITGHGTNQYQKMVEDNGLSGQIEFHQPLPSNRIFAEILASHYVLLFIPSINKDFMGTKFSEIFSLGVPVLHVGSIGYVSRFIEEHRTGYSFRVSELKEKLKWVMEERPEPLPDRQKIEALFNIEDITDRLEKEVLVS